MWSPISRGPQPLSFFRLFASSVITMRLPMDFQLARGHRAGVDDGGAFRVRSSVALDRLKRAISKGHALAIK
jgi:hypothetical protein